MPHAVVVGGSLSGLCAGLALAHAGWTATIVERAAGEPPGGAGLGLDRGLLARVTGLDTDLIPVVSGNRDSAAWGLVRRFLLEAALRTTGIEVMESTTVTGVRESAEASVDTTQGALTADVVVGADGVYSVTRRFVAPDRPTALYAGYMLWRGLLREAEVPGRLARRYWPTPWDRCVGWAVTHGGVFGSPVAGYLPPRLVRDRVVLVGDAAHIASPMTGAGFENAMLDVAALADGLRGASRDSADVPGVLARYERDRLPLVRRLVSSGMAWGRSYLSSV